MTLYHTIKEIEEETQRRQKTVKELTDLGFTTDYVAPNLTEEAWKLVKSEQYRDNHYVQRMKQGENPTSFVDELIAERKEPFLQIRKTKRNDFNGRVKELDQIISTFSLEMPSIYKTGTMLLASPTIFYIFTATCFKMLELQGNKAEPSFESFSLYVMGALGLLCGIGLSEIPHFYSKETKEKMISETKYLSKVLKLEND